MRDFVPVSLVAITPYLLVVNTDVKAERLAEFVALAKSAEFAKMIGDDIVRYGKAVKAANIKLD